MDNQRPIGISPARFPPSCLRTCLKSFSLRQKTVIFQHSSAAYTPVCEQRSAKNRCFMANKGKATLDSVKIAEAEKWDGLHGIVTNIAGESAQPLKSQNVVPTAFRIALAPQ